MGQYDYKNYVLNVKVREDLTDTRALERMMAWDFTLKEWQAYVKLNTPFYNKSAERIILFFIEYNKLDLHPDLYGWFEPIKTTFDIQDITILTDGLAYPRGTVHLKKKRRFDVVIQNLSYALLFDPKNKYMVIPPSDYHFFFEPQRKYIVPPSEKELREEYLGDIKIIISRNTKQFSFEQMKMIVDDMCEYLETDYGVILNQENNEVLYQHK